MNMSCGKPARRLWEPTHNFAWQQLLELQHSSDRE